MENFCYNNSYKSYCKKIEIDLFMPEYQMIYKKNNLNYSPVSCMFLLKSYKTVNFWRSRRNRFPDDELQKMVFITGLRQIYVRNILYKIAIALRQLWWFQFLTRVSNVWKSWLSNCLVNQCGTRKPTVICAIKLIIVSILFCIPTFQTGPLQRQVMTLMQQE